MSEARLPDVEPARFDVAIAGHRDAGQESRRRPVLLRRDLEPSAAPEPPAPQIKAESRKRRRNSGSAPLKVLKKLWIPLVIVAVFVAGGFTVWRLHGVFGSEKIVSYADSEQEETKPFNPKHLRYEIFGAPGTVAQLSYFDVNGDPVQATDVTLPWSLEFPISAAAGIGSIAAQGDTGTIGCRILVDNEVKAEKVVTHEVSAFVSCLLKAA